MLSVPPLCPKQDWLDVCTFHAKQVLFQLHAKSIQTFIKIDGSPDLSYNFSTCENLKFINKKFRGASNGDILKPSSRSTHRTQRILLEIQLKRRKHFTLLSGGKHLSFFIAKFCLFKEL